MEKATPSSSSSSSDDALASIRNDLLSIRSGSTPSHQGSSSPFASPLPESTSASPFARPLPVSAFRKRKRSGGAPPVDSTATASKDTSLGEHSSTPTHAHTVATPKTHPAKPSAPELGEWETNANSCVHFRLVSSPSDLLEGDEGKESRVFHPTFTHQVFSEAQTIKGYKNPKVECLYTAGSMIPWVRFSYDEKSPLENAREADVMDVEQRVFAALAPVKPIASSDEFLEELQRPFTPPGRVIDTYTRLVGKEKATKRTYTIRRGVFDDAGMGEYMQRVQVWPLWFIDRASKIDQSDNLWEIFLIFQEDPRQGEQDSAPSHTRLIGYATAYRFFSFPDRIRLRISQYLIFPPYQHMGHGAHLLRTIYHYARSRPGTFEDPIISDITVEDPSPAFAFLRDVTDLRNIKALGVWSGDCSPPPLTEKMVMKIKEPLKILRAQIEHLHELLCFIHCDTSNPEQYKTYRLGVKRRLYKKYQDWLSSFEEGDPRKKELHEIYVVDVEEPYSNLKKKYLQGSLFH